MDSIVQTLAQLHARDSFALRDPVWGHIYLPAGFAPVLSSSPFAKIRGIKQLGPCHLVYPGASHDRFSHSLGVYQVSCRFLEQFASRGDVLRLSHEKSLAFLAAALCHDIGHFPYTHSLKELPLRDHEALSADLVRQGELAGLFRTAGIVPDQVAAIIDHDLPCQDPELLFYRRVLSGVLDPDKLDYLRRDAYYCGVPYGIQDLDFLLSRLQTGPDGTLRLNEADGSIIEHILFSKYLMYKAVYWHRDVRIATAMIKKFLHMTIKAARLDPVQLYHLDDNGFLNLASQICASPGIPDLPRLVRNSTFYQLCAEIPFCELPPETQSRLANLDSRAELEKALAGSLCPRAGGGATSPEWNVILDVPEHVSFEVDFPLLARDGTVRPFLESSSVFSSRTVHEFTDSLRKVRLLVHPGIDCNPAQAAGAMQEVLGCSRGLVHD